MKEQYINLIFISNCDSNTVIIVKFGTKVCDAIKEYFKKISKSNLLINNKRESFFFLYNGQHIEFNCQSLVEDYFRGDYANIHVNQYINEKVYLDFDIKETIKDNIYTSVYKAQLKSNKEIVAVKKIFKDRLKEEMKIKLMKEEITDEDFKPEIIKFNKEIENMQNCMCQSSVEIYDFFDTQKEFIIVMEYCDGTLLKELCKKNPGFSSNEIKGILLQLNIVFKKLSTLHVAHRDIKLNNILIKYINDKKTKFRVLLSDYGISNQLYSLTKKFTTLAGSQITMAPEILKGKDYTNKCDLWSLGVIIFQLYCKNYPYKGSVEAAILKDIEKKGQSVLDFIPKKDSLLKDLLSKMLVEDPEKRISWEEYFNHPFFKDN